MPLPAPISPRARGGRALKAEIEKLTSIGAAPLTGASSSTDARSSSNRTKDLRLAIWMTVAGAERSGWRDLVRGLAVVSSYVNDLYEPMFPTRPKARTNIVLWLDGARAAESSRSST